MWLYTCISRVGVFRVGWICGFTHVLVESVGSELVAYSIQESAVWFRSRSESL